MPPPTQPTLTTLATFDGNDGEVPGSLVEEVEDNAVELLGTVKSVGTQGGGGVFELLGNGITFSPTPLPLVPFFGGIYPSALVIDASGNLLGTTGGTNGYGTVFEIKGNNGVYNPSATTLASFNGTNGASPGSELAIDSAGNLFGTTSGSIGSGDADGTVFEIAKTSGGYSNQLTPLIHFNGIDGQLPAGALAIDSSGDIFGTTTYGGTNVTGSSLGLGDGTAFELVPNNGTYTLHPLFSFNGSGDGAQPEGGLVIDPHTGNLFGTTSSGGTFGDGTVFEIAKTATGYSNAPTTLVTFNGTDGQNPEGSPLTDGKDPQGSLLIDNKGNLFGTTEYGGTGGGYGTAFEIANTGPTSNPTYASTPTWVFSFNNTDGANPSAGLIADGAGNLFGTTSVGGPLGDGTVFELTNTGFMPCFRRGTRIATPRGERAVEALAVGDLVVTASGAARPIVWLGHRRVDCRRHPNPLAVWPVRVAAGAFGPGLPGRDLFLSPDHALFLDGVLIPVRCLLDPARIVQQPADSVVYWHVELARHDVILAEGLPCESFLDTGNRSAFGNAGAAVQLHPDFSQRSWDGDACAPLVLAGPRLERARARLRAVAYSSSQVRSTITGVRVRAARCSGVQASQSSSLASTPRVAPARSSASASATENHRKSSSSPEPASVPETAAASTVKNRASNRLGEAGGVTARHR